MPARLTPGESHPQHALSLAFRIRSHGSSPGAAPPWCHLEPRQAHSLQTAAPPPRAAPLPRPQPHESGHRRAGTGHGRPRAPQLLPRAAPHLLDTRARPLPSPRLLLRTEPAPTAPAPRAQAADSRIRQVRAGSSALRPLTATRTGALLRRSPRRAGPLLALRAAHAVLARQAPPPRGRHNTGTQAPATQGASTTGHGPPPDHACRARRDPAAALPGSCVDFRQLPPATARRRGGGWGWRR